MTSPASQQFRGAGRKLSRSLSALQPDWAIGVGGFAEPCLRTVLESDRIDSPLDVQPPPSFDSSKVMNIAEVHTLASST